MYTVQWNVLRKKRCQKVGENYEKIKFKFFFTGFFVKNIFGIFYFIYYILLCKYYKGKI